MKFQKLEAIRGFAAFYVVVYHLLIKVKLAAYGIDLLFPFRFGQEAVILFFLLSGFVIQYSFEATKDKSFKSYFFKRFTRIYIPLLFVFLLSYILKCIATRDVISADLRTLFGNIFMLQDVNIKPNVLVGTYMGNTPLWSLAYEWWFYMLFFFIYKTVNERYHHLVVSLLVLLSGLSYIFYPFFLNRVLFYFGIWWIGVELAKLYIFNREITFRNLVYSFFLLSGCIVLCTLNCVLNLKGHHLSFGISPVLELRHFSFSLIVLFFAVLWCQFKWVGFDAIFGSFIKITPISYTLYISHWPLLIDRSYLSFLPNTFSEILVAIFLTIGFSYFIETFLYLRIRNFIYSKLYSSRALKI